MFRASMNELGGLRSRSRRPSLECLEARIVPALVINDLTTGVTPTQLVNNLTGGVGGGITFSNVTYVGDNTSAGTFSGGTGILGFEGGIVLSTGDANDTIGPNDSGSTTTNFGNPGDADLDAISSPTFDATFLQFDFVTAGDTLSFDYVFTSEEYNEFVGAGVNDVFAFFLNGQNVALLPGTMTAVSIDTVNLTANTQFYINNAEAFDPNPAPLPLLDTQMDGLTVVLSVTAQVTPGATNTIKLAISDVGDGSFDSNVFLRAGSFRAPEVPVLNGFRPFRYAFRDLEQNLGGRPPVSAGGTANGVSFDGLITVVNFGLADATGDVTVTLRNLPQDVQLLNRTGTDGSGNPFIVVPAVTLAANATQALRVPVKLSNPNLNPLGTFFVGPYFIDVGIA